MNQVLLRVKKAETKGTSLSHKLFANTINKLLEDETPPHTHPKACLGRRDKSCSKAKSATPILRLMNQVNVLFKSTLSWLSDVPNCMTTPKAAMESWSVPSPHMEWQNYKGQVCQQWFNIYECLNVLIVLLDMHISQISKSWFLPSVS